jgi:glycosyltransferase involved in cell wall biosynthesis
VAGTTLLVASKVSVILPVFNGEATLNDCVQALLRQRDIEFEVLAFNDASTDNSGQLLSSLARSDNRIEVLNHKSNVGLSRTLNEGLGKARNELILIIHQDCVLQGNNGLIGAFEAMKRLRADLVSGAPQIQSLTDLEKLFLLIRAHRLDLNSPRSIPWTEFKCDMTRRDLLRSVGAFNETYRISGEDQDICLRLRKGGALLFQVPELRYLVRVEATRGWIPHLKKEYLYGKTQAILLMKSSWGILRQGTTSIGGERLRNRALGTLWLFAAILGLLSYKILGILGLLPFGILYILRLLVLTSRIFDASYGLSMSILPRVWTAGTIADLAYVCGLARGAIGNVLAAAAKRLS